MTTCNKIYTVVTNLNRILCWKIMFFEHWHTNSLSLILLIIFLIPKSAVVILQYSTVLFFLICEFMTKIPYQSRIIWNYSLGIDNRAFMNKAYIKMANSGSNYIKFTPRHQVIKASRKTLQVDKGMYNYYLR